MPEPCLVEPACSRERPWSAIHVRAPRGDESFVAVPPLSEALELAHRNHERLAEAKAGVQGRTLASIRQWARQEVYQAAREYTAGLVAGENAADAIAPANSPATRHAESKEMAGLPVEEMDVQTTAFYVSGHQPTMFHPGVWVKNFVVGRLAQNNRGLGLNLVVDSDTFSGASVRVPTGSVEHPGVTAVAFDESHPRQPWEEARIIHRELFASFGRRATAAMEERGFMPLLADYWPAAVRHAEHDPTPAGCLTAARSVRERLWGVSNLELPISRLCALEPFLWFSAHLLAHLPRLHAIYNEVLREYRVVNRVRSRTHPVPDLRETDGWLEAPFRVWRAGDRERRRVFARQFAGEIRLSDGERVFAHLPLTPEKDACCAVKELQKLPAQGIRFRTRALTTTLFTRLCFADLFVHGIGGAKYDQMTDRIICRFFGMAAPQFLTLSATLELPSPGIGAHPEDERRLRRLLRELDYNSDRHLPPVLSPDGRTLVAEKQRLIAEQNAVRFRPRSASDSAGSGYERFRRFQEINRQLAALTREERRRIEEELQRTRMQLAAGSLLHDREYAFCLYPAEKLKRFVDHVCASALT
ncbi:MAG TPA: hypothetical protein VKU82_04640 [Planctomycetaceae bacterium]|nr:hypothetical protein [Planctomycetaceae bacterium]